MSDLDELIDEFDGYRARPNRHNKRKAPQCEAMRVTFHERCGIAGYYTRDGRRVCKHHANREIPIVFVDGQKATVR